MAVANALCPPHHWWIEELPGGWQKWACYRCGDERTQEIVAAPERTFAAWSPRTPRADQRTTME